MKGEMSLVKSSERKGVEMSLGKVLVLTVRCEGWWEVKPTGVGLRTEENRIMMLAEMEMITMMKTNRRCLCWGTGKTHRQILFFFPCRTLLALLQAIQEGHGQTEPCWAEEQ